MSGAYTNDAPHKGGFLWIGADECVVLVADTVLARVQITVAGAGAAQILRL